jgi:hypothetical protein
MAQPDAGEELTQLRATQGQPPLVAATQRDRGVGPFARLMPCPRKVGLFGAGKS